MTTLTPNVRAKADEDNAAWDAYVLAHPRATFFHQTGWLRLLAGSFRYRAHHLLAERDGSICGVLPMFACRSIKGRLSLYSLPLTVYGGAVGNDAQAETALLEAARELGRSLGARSIELRNRHASLLDLPVRSEAVTFEKELPGSVDEVRSTLPKKAREAVNQATKRHKLECDFAADLDPFYDLLAASYGSLGTPVFPKRFFAAILDEFPTSLVQVIRHEGRPVASVLSVVFRDTMMPLYSGEASDVKQLKAGNFKYFRLMQEAVARGLRRFDFGRTRSDNAGVLKFKRNQGFEPEALPYQIDELVPGGGGGSNPNSGVYRKLRGIWRRLPGSVAKTVGPRVIRYFP
jgi:FemAB-related protein (PEP-CTERM system-associated)